MGMAGKADIAPLFTVADALRNALVVRADRPLQWRPAPQGQVADIAEGKLLLTTYPEFWKLTVLFEVEAPRNDVEGPDAASHRIVRGRREISYGPGAKLERLALDLAMRGVPGGPAYADAPLSWEPVAGSLRMVVPGGELRILGPANGPCMLTHEDGVGIELLGVDTPGELQRHGLVAWGKRRARPLQIVLQGHFHYLRSIDVVGVIGYHAVTDNTLIALVQVGDQLALLHIDGFITRPIARVSWGEALLGEPFDIDRLLREFSGANPGSTANQPPGRPGDRVFTFEPLTAADPGPPTGQAANAGPRGACPPGHEAMSEPHAGLCRRHLKRLYRRLKGRGARKARELVLLLLEALEWCRHDTTGTRVEVHGELARMLGTPLSGGDRNIRDCIDRLIEYSLFAEWTAGEGEGRRCTLLFGQLHDPNSALIRRIAEEEAAEEAEAAAKATAEKAEAAAKATAAGGAMAAPSPAPETSPAPTPAEEPTPEPAPLPEEPTVAAMPGPDPRATELPSAGTAGTPAPTPASACMGTAVLAVATCTGPSAPGPEQSLSDEEPPSSPGAWEALARGETESRPLPNTLNVGAPRLDVSLRPFVRRGDLFDPRIEVPGSPSHSMWDSKTRPEPPQGSDDDQEPP